MMPSIKCRCSEVLRFGDIPNPIEWLLISDVDFDGFAGQVDAELLYRSMKHLLRCPRCGRLWIFWNGFAAQPEAYVFDTSPAERP